MFPKGVTLLYLVTVVFAFPTAQNDQIMVHHIPMHDVMYIPDFMLGDVAMRTPRAWNNHGRQVLEGHGHVHHQRHEDPQPQKVFTQPMSQEAPPQYPPEESEPQVGQLQQIAINPNHAVFVSTQDEFGNIRTFKISQSSPFLNQNLLIGQEIPRRHPRPTSTPAPPPLPLPALNLQTPSETMQQRVVEEIVEVEDKPIQQETPKPKPLIVQEPVQTSVAVKEKKLRKSKVNQLKKSVVPVVVENPRETQIETPQVQIEVPSVERRDDEPKEKPYEQQVKMIIGEKIPSEKVEVEIVEHKTKKGQDEIVLIGIDDQHEDYTVNPETDELYDTYQEDSEKKEKDDDDDMFVSDEDDMFVSDEDDTVVSDEDDTVEGDEDDSHEKQKRSVSGETLDDIEEEEQTNGEENQPTGETEVYKKDLSETVDEGRRESLLEITPAPLEEEDIPEQIEVETPVESKEKEVYRAFDDFVMEIPKRKYSGHAENDEEQTDVEGAYDIESKDPEELEETFQQVAEEINGNEENTQAEPEYEDQAIGTGEFHEVSKEQEDVESPEYIPSEDHGIGSDEVREHEVTTEQEDVERPEDIPSEDQGIGSDELREHEVTTEQEEVERPEDIPSEDQGIGSDEVREHEVTTEQEDVERPEDIPSEDQGIGSDELREHEVTTEQEEVERPEDIPSEDHGIGSDEVREHEVTTEQEEVERPEDIPSEDIPSEEVSTSSYVTPAPSAEGVLPVPIMDFMSTTTSLPMTLTPENLYEEE